MLRALLPLMLLCGLPAKATAQDVPRIAPRPLESAFHAIENGRWDVAARLAARDGPAAQALVEWYRVQAGRRTPLEVLAFLDANPDWPGLKYLRKQNEENMAHADFDTVLAFYEGYTPQTGIGALNLARALTARGQPGEADVGIVLAWRTLDLSTQEHHAFLDAHAELLAPHHAARLDMAVWRGLKDVAQMLPLVSDTKRALIKTRQKIKAGSRVPESDMPEGADKDPGVQFALFNRHIKRGQEAEAIALILRQSRIEDGLGEPARWAGWRRALARSKMREGEAQLAYDLAAHHGLVEGSGFSDLEWLSGYLALTYMDAPDLALDHFQRFRAAVASPISLGRAGYWLGRAQEASGDSEGAQISYEFGAKYQTSFYGLLAAEKAGAEVDPKLDGTEIFYDWRKSEFAKSTLFKAAVLARATGRINLAERFFTHMAANLDRVAVGQLGAALAAMKEPHLQIMVGKEAAKRGLTLHAPYYALHPMSEMDLAVPMEMALAIARRESEFDPGVVSGANAQGLMQLLPGTAADVARDLGLEHDRARVLSDWRYNAVLGSTYLAQMAGRFDGNVVMVAVGYNAGPARPPRWIERFGDPRGDGTNVVDWIEHIPFRETRNYVMRVAESLPIYRARLGYPALPVPFTTELTGATLKPR